jgi:hypothetical protein
MSKPPFAPALVGDEDCMFLMLKLALFVYYAIAAPVLLYLA